MSKGSFSSDKSKKLPCAYSFQVSSKRLITSSQWYPAIIEPNFQLHYFLVSNPVSLGASVEWNDSAKPLPIPKKLRDANQKSHLCQSAKNPNWGGNDFAEWLRWLQKKSRLTLLAKKSVQKHSKTSYRCAFFPVCALKQNPRKARFHSPGKRTGAFPPPEARSTMK